jgi:hypothetical protein
LAGGTTKASMTNHIPKPAKIRGKAVARVNAPLLRNEMRINPPKMIKKTPALRGAQGTRFMMIQRN